MCTDVPQDWGPKRALWHICVYTGFPADLSMPGLSSTRAKTATRVAWKLPRLCRCVEICLHMRRCAEELCQDSKARHSPWVHLRVHHAGLYTADLKFCKKTKVESTKTWGYMQVIIWILSGKHTLIKIAYPSLPWLDMQCPPMFWLFSCVFHNWDWRSQKLLNVTMLMNCSSSTVARPAWLFQDSLPLSMLLFAGLVSPFCTAEIYFLPSGTWKECRCDSKNTQ